MKTTFSDFLFENSEYSSPEDPMLDIALTKEQFEERGYTCSDASIAGKTRCHKGLIDKWTTLLFCFLEDNLIDLDDYYGDTPKVLRFLVDVIKNKPEHIHSGSKHWWGDPKIVFFYNRKDGDIIPGYTNNRRWNSDKYDPFELPSDDYRTCVLSLDAIKILFNELNAITDGKFMQEVGLEPSDLEKLP